MVEMGTDEIRMILKRQVEQLELTAVQRWGVRGAKQFLIVMENLAAQRRLEEKKK